MGYTILQRSGKNDKDLLRKIRFRLDKGPFSFMKRYENDERYFAKSDVERARKIECLRQCEMNLKEICEYAEV